MANGFDRRGAVVGAVLLLLLVAVGLLLAFPPKLGLRYPDPKRERMEVIIHYPPPPSPANRAQ
jgi:hypothetical protein